MDKKYVYILTGVIIFALSVVYVVWNQTSFINKIFTEHRKQLQTEIKAIQAERLVLKSMIDSLEVKINLDKKELLNDIDNFLKKYGKK
jgi:hypothetical protein